MFAEFFERSYFIVDHLQDNYSYLIQSFDILPSNVFSEEEVLSSLLALKCSAEFINAYFQ